MPEQAGYHVGGVATSQPFKIRRLGHLGVDIGPVAQTLDFFIRDLGLFISDAVDLRVFPGLEKVSESIDDPRGFFLSVASDHHSLVLLPRQAALALRAPTAPADMTNGQMSFQVGSIEEVIAAKSFMEANGIVVPRIGRDLPGSNWHTYFPSPDGLTIELYYGMEQIGWTRTSKPLSMYGLRSRGVPALPILTEHAEVDAALAGGADLSAGHRPDIAGAAQQVVGGVDLARPFRGVNVGPAYFFVDDVERSLDFYTRLLGLTLTERVEYEGHSCVYLRAGSEHHSLALLDVALRDKLGVGTDSRNYAIGLKVGSYDQLRRAGPFLTARGWRQTVPVVPELHPGIDRALYFEDPRRNRIMLYYYIEQIGWDGRPRPPELRPAPERRPVAEWPEQIDAPSDVYADSPLMGPLG
jgi:catechol 2,3-dioxygenase-like lactoylglutathione lyase family enzyme